MTPPGAHATARVLVRLHGEPLGYLDVPLSGSEPTPDPLRGQAELRFDDRIAGHLAQEGAEDVRPCPPPRAGCPQRVVADELVSVVVCTRDRAEQLADCLLRLRALTYPAL